MNRLILLLPDAVNGDMTIDLRGGAPVVVPGGGGTGGGGTGGGGTGGGGLPPAVGGLADLTPYPFGSQTLRDIMVGATPRGFRFVIPPSAPPHGVTIKVYGVPGECNRDRQVAVNGVVTAPWWVKDLITRTEDDFNVPGDWKPGDVVEYWMRHPNGEEMMDRFELLANR